MGVETAIAGELLGAELLGGEILGGELLGGEALLGAGEGALTAGEFVAGAGAAVPELGVAAAPGLAEAAPALYSTPGYGEIPIGAEGAYSTQVASGGMPTQVLSAAADYYGRAPFVESSFPASEYRTGLEALQQVSGLPYAGSVADTALATAAGAAGEGFSLEEFLSKYGKYGLPLGLGALGALQTQGLQRQARGLKRELGTLPGATKAGQVGEQMVTAAQAGQLPPGQQFQMEQAKRAEKDRLEAYLAKARISDSSTAQNLRNQIEDKYRNMQQAAVGQYLNQGLQAMGISDQATSAAIRAGYQADQNAANLMQRYAAAATQMIPGVYRPAVASSTVA